MAVQNPFFGKREPESFQPRTSPNSSSVLSTASSSNPSSPAPTLPSSVVAANAAAAAAAAAAQSVATESVGSKLTVGPNIKLKGVEITDCDTLVVEGTVEATMDSRVIQITQEGAFRGSAEIDIAEIHGTFDGTLSVRDKLVIYSTGKVTGKIRYGKLVVEEGGQIAGEIEAGFAAASSRGRSSVHSAAHSSSSDTSSAAAVSLVSSAA